MSLDTDTTREASMLWTEEKDAKDLAQDFFLWMMESDFLSRADRGRGRFRVFVKVARTERSVA